MSPKTKSQYSEAQIWSVIKGKNHPFLSPNERITGSYMPLIKRLFPGIDYSDFDQVMKEYVQPVLSKLFPDIVKKPLEEVERNKVIKIEPFLPSKGYEHSDNPEWKKQLDELLK